jgi:hypothetical protein
VNERWSVRNGWNECGGRCRHNMTAGWTGRQERNAGGGGVRKNATAWTFKRTLERDGCRSVRNGWNECEGRCRHNMAAGWTGRQER